MRGREPFPSGVASGTEISFREQRERNSTTAHYGSSSPKSSFPERWEPISPGMSVPRSHP